MATVEKVELANLPRLGRAAPTHGMTCAGLRMVPIVRCTGGEADFPDGCRSCPLVSCFYLDSRKIWLARLTDAVLSVVWLPLS